RLRERGPAFPNDFRRKDLAAELHRTHGEKTKEALETEKPTASVAGRMLLKRVMGKASFATLQDMSGQIQVYVNNDVTGAETLQAGAGDARVLRRARLSRSRDADDAADPGRCGGASLQDAPQRARHGPLPAHRAGALSQAPRRRRHGKGVRDQPQFQERGYFNST